MLRTRFCERFGIDAPIVVAPMGPDLTGVELVAAYTPGARGRLSALHIGAARRISQRYERCDAVPLTGSTALLPMSRLKLAPSGPNGS